MKREAYRHHPMLHVRKNGDRGEFFWDREPTVAHYHKIDYFNPNHEKIYEVPISATPIILEGIGVLVASDDGYIRLLDRELSKSFWKRRAPASLYASPIYLAESDRFIIASTAGHICALDLRSQVIWQEMLEGAIYGTPTYNETNKSLLVSTFNHQLVCLSSATGQRLWQRHLPEPWGQAFESPQAFRDPYASPAIDDQGRIFVSAAETIGCYSSEGKCLWRLDTGHALRSSPALCYQTQTLAQGAVDGHVWLVDYNLPRITAKIHLDGKILHSPAVSFPIVCFGNEFGVVTGIDLRDRTIAWRQTLPAQMDHTSMSVTPRGDFVFITSLGNAVALDRDSGRFLWETSQVMDIPEHDRRMHTTPVVSGQGEMVCGSYSGYLYRFCFRQKTSPNEGFIRMGEAND